MALWRSRPQSPSRELADVWPTLGSAIERFGRDVARNAKKASRRKPAQARVRPVPRLPSPQTRRPAAHPPASPERLRSGTPRTVLERQRIAEARRRGGRPAIAVAAEAGAQRVAGAIRQRLLDLRAGLARLRGRVTGKRSASRR